MERGTWVWDVQAKQLKLEKSDLDLPDIHFTFGHQSKNTTVTTFHQDMDRVVTLDDVKRAAIHLIHESTLKSVRRSSTLTFDQCYSTESMDTFLWCVLKYLACCFHYQQASTDEAVHTEGIVGDSAREKSRESKKNLEQQKSNLSAAYISLISGLGIENIHHSLQGRLRFSRTQSDQQVFELIYEFTMIVSWITFRYKHWDTIHTELGSFLRTSAFNRDISVRNPMENMDQRKSENDSKSERLTFKVFYNRPDPGLLPKLKSPAVENLYPRLMFRQSVSKPIPNICDQHESVRIGIIGECYSNYNPLTLKLKEEVQIESQTQIEEDEETDEYYDDDDEDDDAESDDEI